MLSCLQTIHWFVFLTEDSFSRHVQPVLQHCCVIVNVVLSPTMIGEPIRGVKHKKSGSSVVQRTDRPTTRPVKTQPTCFAPFASDPPCFQSTSLGWSSAKQSVIPLNRTQHHEIHLLRLLLKQIDQLGITWITPVWNPPHYRVAPETVAI
ncbi:hypothetical protein HG66A1_31800 [Gimesia chilikensis]|uniref:Uncharacterized protein n=1 Tax=Gimesia chilikensis TaxID=2605989 RepID=A0A517PPU2_9PLAN|nr:hypothetical protein HG66A1_31800 [Gimesia chilikensis]